MRRNLVVGLMVAAAAFAAGPLAAQEDLNRGKTPAQLFVSDCADCHKNPRALTNRSNPYALTSFLRVHYTASRESAAAIAGYLVSLGVDPVARTPSRPPSSSRPRPSTAQEQGKPEQGKPGQPAQPVAKPDEAAPSSPPEAVPSPSEAAPAAPSNQVPASESAPAAPPATEQ